MEINKEIGLIFKDRRKALRLTQQQVAEKTGVTDGYISRVERGGAELTKPTLQALLKALKIEKPIANRFIAGIVQPGSELLDDGSLRERNGLTYLATGGMALPAGCMIVDQGASVRPRWAIKLPSGGLIVTMDDDLAEWQGKELPDGTMIDSRGHLRLPGEQRHTPLSDEEWRLVELWRYLSPSKKKIASAMLKSLQICENLDRASQARGEEPIALEL